MVFFPKKIMFPPLMHFKQQQTNTLIQYKAMNQSKMHEK